MLRDVHPTAFTALLTAGAATLVGSAFAVSAFLTAVRLLGPGLASLLVTVEVPPGLVLATFALGERLTTAQQIGAAAVVDAIVLLQIRIRLPRRRLAEVRMLPVPGAIAESADALAA